MRIVLYVGATKTKNLIAEPIVKPIKGRNPTINIIKALKEQRHYA
jgi:hypothetical protein